MPATSAMLPRLRRLCGWVAVLLALGSFPQSGRAVTLEWDPSPDAWVAGYAIHYGTASGAYAVRLELGNRTSATITNLTPGTTYYFVATAYTFDGQESLPSNEVSYTVPDGPPPDPLNQPPCVFAGDDQAIMLSSEVTLAGAVSDDGLPSKGTTLGWEWSAVSGPGPVRFESAKALDTSASFTVAGVYVIRLTATDGDLVAFDDVVVTVVPDVPENPVGLVVEAEEGWLSYPMQRGWGVRANGHPTAIAYIFTDDAEQGAAGWRLEVPETGAYVIWARLSTTDNPAGSLRFWCDDSPGGILVANSTAGEADNWHWACLMVSGAGPKTKGPVRAIPVLEPRRFILNAGPHWLTVTGGKSGLLLDKLLVTNDRSFVPVERVVAPSVPVISGLRLDAGKVCVTWSSMAGATYRLVYKDSLADAHWLPASPKIVAVGSTLSWFETTDGASGQRYFSILAEPE